MSLASDKGKKAELEVRNILRRAGFNIQRDRKSGAGKTTKTDIKDWHGVLRLAIEVKNHATWKPREWMKQAKAAASMGQIPTVVMKDDSDLYAMVPFKDLVDLLAELKQTEQANEDMRTSAVTVQATGEQVPKLSEAVAKKIRQAGPTCRFGHLADGFGYCNIKGCPGQRGYKPKKAKA